MQLGRGDPADVAEALHDAPLLVERPAEPGAGALDDHDHARSGRLVTEHGAPDRDRLAGHDLRDRVALLHRVRVHHPRHRLLVRRHVRRRDVELRADERRELGGEPAGDARQLVLRQLVRAAADAALRAAVRQAEERALPRHPHRERRALAEVDRGVVADAALRRPEHGRVLHPVGRKRGDRPVVEANRQRQDHRTLRMAEAARDEVRDLGELQGLVQLRRGLCVQRRLPLERGRRVHRHRAGHGGRVLVKEAGPRLRHPGPAYPAAVEVDCGRTVGPRTSRCRDFAGSQVVLGDDETFDTPDDAMPVNMRLR